ncbi:MAG: GDSL-type esterase/lipase family protein [Clostridiales bacterium]|nr:GDSL-type esterase/lipase family protein [Clostridiales bacterium]MCD8154488.1 GDSL-type esterase/lipase family protein [Clostridiales bacterium]
MKRILCIGDSITDCGRLTDAPPLGHGYVYFLRHMPEWSGNSPEILNRGTDGFTVARLLENVSRAYLPLSPDLVTILIGINNIALMKNTGRTEEQQEAMMVDFFRTYDLLLEKITGSGAKVLLMEPFVFPWPAELQTWVPSLQQMSRGIADLSEKYQAPFLPLQHSLLTAVGHHGMSRITPDGIHLTEQGHRLLAKKLYTALLEHQKELLP